MKSDGLKSGYVECIFSYGKCGFVREILGESYYFNSKSFAPGRKRLKFGELVQFRVTEGRDPKTGEPRLVCCDLRAESDVNDELMKKFLPPK